MIRFYYFLMLFGGALQGFGRQKLTDTSRRDTLKLTEVTVSTGYQVVPRERATGSFAKLDKGLVQRVTSTTVLDRLRDVVPGLLVDSRLGTFRIRGQSTLFSNADPLIVVDGFPYNEPLANLNPNDIESISVLKDAAAASIWGTRAGNGVVVITTRQGAFNKPPALTLDASVNVGQRPDLFYIPRMSTADYIGIERRLYNQGYFTPVLASPYGLPLSPVVELLLAKPANLEAQLAALGRLDVRNDLSKYWYRPSVNQQYAASLSGGNANSRYLFSAGWDKNVDNLVGNGLDRVTLKGTNTWSLVNRHLDVTLGVNYVQSQTRLNNPGLPAWNQGALLYPYARLNGPITHDYRLLFIDSARRSGLLDWNYRPLDELRLADNMVRLTDYRLNAGAVYRLPFGLKLEALYQYDQGQSTSRNLHSADSYYTRNLINRYTQVVGTELDRPVPYGGILDLENGTSVNHDFRVQLDFDRSWGSRHLLTAIGGYEIQSMRVLSDANRLYGYDALHATSRPVDGVTEFPFWDNNNAGTTIPLNQSEHDGIDHTLSYYANAAYTYDGRLTLSGSARLDRSNLFGVAANQKGVPLWSTGLAWDIARESFYHWSVFPELRLRATYGFSGNINKSLSAYTTANYLDASNQGTLLPFATIINPPNPNLRWERDRHINLGLDFATSGHQLSGSLEVFWKKGSDLIGSTSYAPSTGIIVFTGNTAATRGKGLDFNLESRNLNGAFHWVTNLMLSYVTDVVAGYDQQSTTQSYLEFGASGGYPLTGRPLLSVYSYRWAGLEASTGDPQGYLQGVVSKDYAAIASSTRPGDLIYNGPARPPVFGALRNTFGYGRWSLSLNISYELGFYFRKSSVRYGADNGLGQQSGDYALRWQKPGDEIHTNVPSVPASPNIARDDFYTYASALVQKGDHVRIRDARLSYRLKWTELYVYGANLGFLWRANKIGQDPDYPNNFPAPLTIAGGIRINY